MSSALADEVRAIVAEAHSLDRTVTAHVTGRQGARIALAAGVDELAHMPCREAPAELGRELAEAGIEIVGTLHVEESLSFCPYGVETARAFVRAGGRLLYGSDFGNLGIPPAIDVRELELMRRAGLSNLDVLKAATGEAGAHLGLAPLGRLVPDAPADLIAVRGDATTSLDALDDKLLVVAGGFLVFDRGKINVLPT